MFACSMYPANERFLQTVRVEIKQQIRRLQHHPSVVLWAGNNENEAALRGNWYGTRTNYSAFASDYVALYVDTIKKMVTEEDTTRDYLVSSPTNGLKSEEENYIAENPYSSLYGDGTAEQNRSYILNRILFYFLFFVQPVKSIFRSYSPFTYISCRFFIASFLILLTYLYELRGRLVVLFSSIILPSIIYYFMQLFRMFY